MGKSDKYWKVYTYKEKVWDDGEGDHCIYFCYII